MKQLSPLTPATEEWWVPPARNAKRQEVEVLAYDRFGTIDEHDLGAVFTAELEPIVGAGHFFEDRAPKVVHPNEADFHWLRASGTNSADLGFHFLMVDLGLNQSLTHESLVFHSHEITDAFSLVETTHMHQPPPEAVFYLAEVHRGTSVDFVIEGDYSETGKRLGIAFQTMGASAVSLESTQRYHVRLRALGLKDFDGQGALAMTLDEIKRSFRAQPATTELVFRTIPGRTYTPPKTETPFTALDEPSLELADGAWHRWTVEPGRYRFVGHSAPNGLGLSWSAGVTCDPEPAKNEWTSLETICTVSEQAAMTVSNPTTWGLGDPETMSIYLGSLPK